ncbi:MAG: hypothetical protein R2764_05455 [Bacteroidales bacterium]
MMIGIIRWPVTIVLILFLSHSFGQIFKKEINRYNDDGKRDGKWICWWDVEKKIPMSEINFKDGYEKGVQKEYNQDGTLRLKFRFYKNRVRVKYYHANGTMDKKGWSVMDYKEMRYYWHGKWKFYSEEGKPVRSAIYQYGTDTSYTLNE